LTSWQQWRQVEPSRLHKVWRRQLLPPNCSQRPQGSLPIHWPHSPDPRRTHLS
jgi:hypothetical protein